MVDSLLAKDLREYLREKLADVKLPLEGGGMRSPIFLNGYRPPKRSDPKVDDYPYILVRVDGGKVVNDAKLVDVSIFLGWYSDEYEGHEYGFNLKEDIELALYDLPCGTLSEKYQLREFSWDIPPDHPYPFWHLVIKTQWLLFPPEVNVAEYLD